MGSLFQEVSLKPSDPPQAMSKNCPWSPSSAEELLPPVLCSQLLPLCSSAWADGCQGMGMGKCPLESGGASYRVALEYSRWLLQDSVCVLSRCRSGLGSDLYLTPVPFLPPYVKGLSVHVILFNLLWPRVMVRNEERELKRDVGFMTSEDGLELESYPYHLRGLSRPCLASGEA